MFCGRTCANSSRQNPSQHCAHCGAEFRRPPSLRAKYCSHSCYAAAYVGVPKPHSETHRARISASKRGQPNPKRVKPRVTKTCLHCGEAFEVSNSEGAKARSNRQFCGSDCWYEFVRTHPDAHGRFRGGREPYYGPNWAQAARETRKRDEYTCQDCGLHQTRPALDVHHLVPRRAFNGDYVSANEIANLITLCKRCHSLRELALDAEYGRPRFSAVAD